MDRERDADSERERDSQSARCIVGDTDCPAKRAIARSGRPPRRFYVRATDAQMRSGVGTLESLLTVELGPSSRAWGLVCISRGAAAHFDVRLRETYATRRQVVTATG